MGCSGGRNTASPARARSADVRRQADLDAPLRVVLRPHPAVTTPDLPQPGHENDIRTYVRMTLAGPCVGILPIDDRWCGAVHHALNAPTMACTRTGRWELSGCAVVGTAPARCCAGRGQWRHGVTVIRESMPRPWTGSLPRMSTECSVMVA